MSLTHADEDWHDDRIPAQATMQHLVEVARLRQTAFHRNGARQALLLLIYINIS